jgi:hypothetical protein
MVSKKQSLESSIINSMKEAGFATKKDLERSATKEDVNSTVLEASDAILHGMELMFAKQNKMIKRQLKNAPTRKEFESLKSKFDKYHPVN